MKAYKAWVLGRKEERIGFSHQRVLAVLTSPNLFKPQGFVSSLPNQVLLGSQKLCSTPHPISVG